MASAMGALFTRMYGSGTIDVPDRQESTRVISTYLVEHSWLTTTALVAFLVFGPPAAAALTRVPRILAVLVGLAAAAILASTIVPTDRAIARGCEVAWTFPTLGKVEVTGNIVLFIPIALLLGTALRRPFSTFLACISGSALIELTQALITDIGRSCDTTDWEANTIGSALGAALAGTALWLVRRSSETKAAQ